MDKTFSREYLRETALTALLINHDGIEKAAHILSNTREKCGRLFIIGVGGSAANASHAVNDFRKICNIECYSPVDNVSELTAITNDLGWDSTFAEWLKESKISNNDTLLVFSVGGGSAKRNISANIIKAIDIAGANGAKIISVVGRDGGYAGQMSDALILIPTIEQTRITPHVEEFASVVFHLLVSHPLLKLKETTWESTK